MRKTKKRKKFQPNKQFKRWLRYVRESGPVGWLIIGVAAAFLWWAVWLLVVAGLSK